MMDNHIVKSISSKVKIYASRENIWENITNVKIEHFSDPAIFRILNIPKPLRAEVISVGVGGIRIAHFNTKKKFIQRITEWQPFTKYSFSFNPEKGFTVCYFFDISDGVFRMLTGDYDLTTTGSYSFLQLETTYSLDKRVYFLFNLPVRFILKLFQRYLLSSIKKNST